MNYSVLMNCFGLLLLTISSNYSDKLLSCDIQEKYMNNVWIKHIITYLLLLFFIIVVDKKAFEEASMKKWILPRVFLVTFVVYLMFLVVTRMDAIFVLIILFCIVVYMLLDIEQLGKEQSVTDWIERIQIVLAVIIGLVAVYGFVTYFLRQKHEYGDQFKYLTFLVGTPTCTRFRQE